MSERRAALAGTAALAVLVWLVYGFGFVGYDSVYALIWGQDLIHGDLPDYDLPGSPTPHPLANVVTALLAPLGDQALTGFAALAALAFGALGWAAYRLGRELLNVPVGVLFAVIVLTRDHFANGLYQAYVEMPAVALVLWAILLEVRRPRCGAPALWLLFLAGLLRPEAWLLAGAYALYLLPPLQPRERWRPLALAAAAPLLWAASDLLLTGDPLHSLHHTQVGAELLARPREFDVALQAAPIYLEDILHSPVVWGGIAGFVLGLRFLYERSILPAAVLAIGLAGFLVLGLADVPLLPRYYYVPATMLALFCGVAAFGWLQLPEGSTPRRAWMAGAGVLAIALAVSVPDERDRLDAVRSASLERGDLQEELRDFVRAAGPRSWIEACSPLYTSDGRVLALVSFWLDRQPGLDVAGSRDARFGVFVGPAARDDRDYVLDRRLADGAAQWVPDGYEPVEEDRKWTLYRGC
jgi:hypothetical protein